MDPVRAVSARSGVARLVSVALAVALGLFGALATSVTLAAPEPAPHRFPGASFLLPQGARVAARWVLPPTDGTRTDAFFSVDAAGAPLIAYGEATLMDPGKRFLVTVERKFAHLTHLANGVLLLASGDDLGLLAAPKQKSLDKKGLPIVGFQPLVSFAVKNIDVLASVGNHAYVAGLNPQTGRFSLYLLRSLPGAGLQDVELRYESQAPITAVTASDDAIFVAVGREVLRISNSDGSVVPIYTHPAAIVTGLALTPAGLAASTGLELVMIGPNGALEIMRSQGQHYIVWRGDTLFVFFRESLGVLAVDGLADLARFHLAVRPVAAGETQPPLAITAVRFFESDPPPQTNPNFATSFEAAKVRGIGAQVELRAPTRSGAQKQHTATVSWYGPDGGKLMSSAYPVAAERPDGTAQLIAWIGGKAKPGSGYSPRHWEGRLRFTEALAKRYPGRYRVTIAVDGIAAGEWTFTLSGPTDPMDAIQYDDVAMLETLLAQGLNPRQKDKDGDPLLKDALQYGTTRAVELLLRKGADPKDTDKEGYPALAILTKFPNPPDWRAKAELLIRHGADVNARVGKDQKPLVYNTMFRPDYTAFLIRQGAGINPPDKTASLLSSAVESSFNCTEELIAALVARGADLNAPVQGGMGSFNGLNPLGTAIYFGNRDCVGLLLAKGARPGIVQRQPNRWEHSALYVALSRLSDASTPPHSERAENAREIVRILLAKGATLIRNEVGMMFRGEAPSFFDAATLVRALEQIDTIPGEGSGLGLQEALKSADPAIQELALRRSVIRVRELTAAATDKYRLADARDVCKLAYAATESGYQPLQVDILPELLPPAQGAPAKPTLGISVLTREATGAYVRSPVPGGPAARAGLRPGDILLALDTQAIKKADDVVVAASRLTPGAPVRVTFLRDDPMRLPDLQLGCGLVERELGEGMGEMNLSRWLVGNPDAPQAGAVRALLGR